MDQRGRLSLSSVLLVKHLVLETGNPNSRAETSSELLERRHSILNWPVSHLLLRGSDTKDNTSAMGWIWSCLAFIWMPYPVLVEGSAITPSSTLVGNSNRSLGSPSTDAKQVSDGQYELLFLFLFQYVSMW